MPKASDVPPPALKNDRDYLREDGPRYIENGFDVVPIHDAEKRPVGYDWQTLKLDEKRITAIADRGARQGEKYGVGINTASTPVLDLDIRDLEVRQRMQAQFELDVGLGPVRGGNYPKVAIICQTDTPFAKIVSKEYFDQNGTKHHVEILGRGQQAVVAGVHPDTGRSASCYAGCRRWRFRSV